MTSRKPKQNMFLNYPLVPRNIPEQIKALSAMMKELLAAFAKYKNFLKIIKNVKSEKELNDVMKQVRKCEITIERIKQGIKTLEDKTGPFKFIKAPTIPKHLRQSISKKSDPQPENKK